MIIAGFYKTTTKLCTCTLKNDKNNVQFGFMGWWRGAGKFLRKEILGPNLAENILRTVVNDLVDAA